jgi:TPR repeat protein
MFDLGEGVPVDQHRAIVYYKEAALKGQASAEYALGTYFYAGQEVAQNYETARKLFSAAAMQQQVDGMFNLAVMLDRGEGGPKDEAMAYVWFSLAKAAGHQSADGAIKEVAAQLTPQQRAKADAILRPGK